SSILYDITEDDEYYIIVEIRNPSAIGSNTGGSLGESPRVTVSATAESFPEALRKISIVLERTVFGGHNKVRFITENHAKKGVFKLFDYTSRDFIADERAFIIMVKAEEPKSIYEVKIGLSDLLGQHIVDLYKNQEKMNSRAVFVDALQFLQQLTSEGKQPVAGVVEIVPCDTQLSPKLNDKDKVDQDKKLIYSGLAAFKADKLVGYFNGEETRAYNFITNNIIRAFYSVKEPDYHIATIVTNSKCNVKAIPNGNSFAFDINISVVLNVTQADGKFDIMKIDLEDFISQQFNEKIRQEIAEAVKKSQQEFESDIFGFGDYIHNQHPQKWKTIKQKWGEMYPEAVINIKVNSKIKFTGQIKESAEFLKENQ
ncbi:MAG: Ger(x)C family spore germination protein, partial [Clostridia bacterium]|nr:Ger(x)C family spore germination protein [Clostridia bacterium]